MVEFQQSSMESNTRSLTIFSIYLVTCASLTVLIVRDLYLQAKRRDDRRANVNKNSQSSPRLQLFGALAAASVSITWYYMFSFFSLSYRVWAFEHGVPLPHGLLDAFSIRDGRHLRLGSWLKDVQLFRDAWEVVLETSPRLFWSQPIFFITAAWSIFLGIESHRRKIPHAWSYMILGQIVAISFAQNLFFLAVLLFPIQSTSPASGHQAKPVNWTAARSLYGICILATFASVCTIPYVTGTQAFLRVLLLPHIVLVVPCFLHAIVPASWGVKHGSMVAADHYMRSVFELALVLALYCQTKVAVDAYMYPHENGHLHRHSALYLNTGPSPIFGNGLAMIDRALYDHPAVSSVGWDTLLCTISFLCWKVA